MMCSLTWKRCLRALAVALLAAAALRQGFAQSPPARAATTDGAAWSTYNGDLSGRRYSSLTQINSNNVRYLTLAWAYPTHGQPLKCTPLEIDGVLYFTLPDHVWAVDAATGQQIWTFERPASGNKIGQRGVAFYQNRIYLGTSDAHLLCLDAHTGKPIWDVEVADVKFGYYLSVAPVVVKGKVILGTSGDQTNVSHFLEARDWRTGALLWKTESLPAPGSAAASTWPNAAAMSHGGGPMWLSGTFDPELNLLYWGTGNPHPVLAGNARPGDNLYTCSILAINPDTGSIVWYFQPSPHDTHDWDAVETPVLIDGEFAGKPRKLLAQASRNGYFFLLDRQTGKPLLTTQFVKTNWASGVDAQGRPIPDPAKEPQADGALVEGNANGGTNWMAPSFSPETGLFYVNAQRGYAFWYSVLDEKGAPVDHQGGGSIPLFTDSVLLGIDYRTGKLRWDRSLGEGNAGAGILTTAGHLLFTGDLLGNVFALDAANGSVLWHTRPGSNLSNAPMTYELHGRQYVVTGVNDTLYAWTLPERQ
jgi:alcohol dehydrogenase (cytochrome c)